MSKPKNPEAAAPDQTTNDQAVDPAAPFSSFVSPFGHTHPERDRREMCPFCYNEDTRRIVGVELIPYEEYHAGEPFKAFECEACRGKFHFATNA